MGKMYNTNAVSDRTGATLRQLQWWDENSLICPERSGRGRRYSSRQVQEVRFLMALRRNGISLQRSRALLEQFQKHFSSFMSGFFVTDGKRFITASDPHKALKAIMVMKCAGLAVVDLSSLESNPK